MSTSFSPRVTSTLADLDMPTAHLVIELALDGRYQLPDDELNQDRVLSNLERAFAEQEQELMRYSSVYGLSQNISVAPTGSLDNVWNADNITNIMDREGNDSEGSSHGIACPSNLLDDLPSIRSETDTLSDNEDEDNPRPHDAYSIPGASEAYYDDLPSIRSETPESPDDIANDSRRGSAYYLEKARSLEYLPSISSETFSRDEDDDEDPLSDDAYTLAADGNGHYDDLPSICSETRALSEDDYSLVGAHESPTGSMSSWATLAPSVISAVSSGVIRADTTISPESLVEDASDSTSTGMMHTLHRCSKVLLDVIDGIGCIRWRKIRDGILGSIFAPQTQDSPEPSL